MFSPSDVVRRRLRGVERVLLLREPDAAAGVERRARLVRPARLVHHRLARGQCAQRGPRAKHVPHAQVVSTGFFPKSRTPFANNANADLSSQRS